MGNANIKLLEDAKSEHRLKYEWKSASVTVAGTAGDTDITGETGFTTLFDTVPRAHHIKVEASAAAYIRVNSATNDIITLGATTPYENHYGIIESLYVSTGAGAATITVKLR